MLIFKILIFGKRELSQNSKKNLMQVVEFVKCWTIFVP